MSERDGLNAALLMRWEDALDGLFRWWDDVFVSCGVHDEAERIAIVDRGYELGAEYAEWLQSA